MPVVILLERHTLGILFLCLDPFGSKPVYNISITWVIRNGPIPEHQAIAMQDNISIHRSRVAEEAIGRVRIQWLANHPSQSPDLNPIEDVWNPLKRRIHQRPIAPRNEAELLEAAEDEWGRITPEDYVESILFYA